MSETIVLYSSRYGAARQYAHMRRRSWAGAPGM